MLHLDRGFMGEHGGEGSRRKLTDVRRFTLTRRRCEGRREGLRVRGRRGGGSEHLFTTFPDPLVPTFRPPWRWVDLLAVKIRSRYGTESVCATMADILLLPSGWEAFQPCQRARHMRRHREADVSHAAQQTLITVFVEHHVVLKLMLRFREKKGGK